MSEAFYLSENEIAPKWAVFENDLFLALYERWLKYETGAISVFGIEAFSKKPKNKTASISGKKQNGAIWGRRKKPRYKIILAYAVPFVWRPSEWVLDMEIRSCIAWEYPEDVQAYSFGVAVVELQGLV